MNLGKPILEELFNKQIRFRIPLFQRHYVWNEIEQWMPLWEDFLNKVNERINGNYLFSEKTPMRDDIIGMMKERPSLKERASTSERIIGKIYNFVETFISGIAS